MIALSSPAAPLDAERAPVVLSAKGVSVAYRRPGLRPVNAVRDFSLTIRKGEFVALMGEPGSGKSTAAMAMMGLARPPGIIVAGSIAFNGKDLLSMSAEAQRRIRGGEIGLIVQNPRLSLHPLLTVGEQICNVVHAHQPTSAKEAKTRAIEMLRLVGINDPERRFNAYAHELSTGMTQRVLIAMALSSRPGLLIADEPTSGLDVTIQTQFLDNMWRAARDTGSAVLLITQNLGIVANYCDRVVVMQHGALIEDAPVRQFFTAPAQDYSRRVLALQQGVELSDASGVDPLQSVADRAPLLTVVDMTKEFPVRGSSSVVHAVDRVSFTIRPGECLGLVGESGSGKTTVGRCLMRLESPQGGRITFGGDRVSDLSNAKFRPYRSKMQIVFQDPLDSMNPLWTVQQVIGELIPFRRRSDPGKWNARIAELLTLVGLSPEIAKLRPRQMSAGPQQRVAIARAIASKPDFLVLDEPTSALTPETTAEIVKLLMDLSQRLGLATLFISHDLATVKYVCHRVAVMYLGQIVEIGAKRQVFSAPAHPYTQALLKAHLFPDIASRRVDRTEMTTLQGEIPSAVDLPAGCYLYGRCPQRVAACATMQQTLEVLRDGRSVRCWRVSSGQLAIPPAAHP
jgi:oligopeptide/dipeptide ABC transporter ATP-binding protein